MIEFGLFSSQIPYVIFIALYMLYFGASSRHRQDKEGAAPDSNVSEKQIGTDTRFDNNTFVYRINSYVKNVVEKYTGKIDHLPGYSISVLFYIRDHILPAQPFAGHSVFSRPPPFSSLF
jgi:hypothetical protein